MKFTVISLLAVALFLSMASPAFAYPYGSSYSPYGFSPYRNYFEQSSFTSDSYLNRNDYDFSRSFLLQDSDIFSRDYSATSDFERLFSDSRASTGFQDFFQDASVQYADGYALTKGPCATKTVHGDFKGKYNDFTLTSSVCDNIEGNFFRDNRVNSNVRNSYGFTDSSLYSDTFRDAAFVDDAFTQDRNSFAEQSLQETGSSRLLETVFGTGTLIVLR